jgi:uncharacterized protein (DUF1501 family)
MIDAAGGRRRRHCDGVTRRDMLRAGMLSALGLSLADLLRIEAAQAAKTGVPSRDTSCILIFLEGGASHMETFDMKPDAPAEQRGEFKPIKTNVPGIEICEHLPKLAQVTDRYAILRSVKHANADHGGGAHYMCTGIHPAAGFQEVLTRPNNQHPFFGAVLAHEKGISGELPPFISLPKLLAYGGPAFLGPAYMPFVIESDPSSPSFNVRDLRPAPGVEDGRLADRRRLRAALNRSAREELAKQNPRVAAVDTFYERAYDLVTSEAARRAFDISREPAQVRDAYGRTSFGQSALMGRRLVEAGCRFVSIEHPGWDNHTTIFPTLKDDLLPQVDAGMSALLRDLDDRGLLESTLVVMFGEFGRTPVINKDAGRDHWPQVNSVLIAGGGTKRGVVIGASDTAGAEVTERPITPEDMAATIYAALGVDHRGIVHTPLDRPVQIVSGGEPVRELF